MNRIEALYSFIDINDKVVDVGCDQAKLGIMLAKRKQSSIASDVSINVINRAKKDISILGYDEYIDLRVSDGLAEIKEGETDTLVLSGMGTHTMIDILNKTKLRFNKIITISNNNHDILRYEMNKLNYKVSSELIIKENNKYYNLITFVEGNYDYNDFELNFGMNHVNESMYREYLDFLLNKYKNIKNNSCDKNIKIKKLIDMLENTF